MSKALNAENLREEIEKVEAQAAVKFTAAEKVKAEMIESGVNPLTDTDAFAKVDEAYMEHSVLADEVGEMRHRLTAISSWGEGGTTPSQPSPQPRPFAGSAEGVGPPMTAGRRLVESPEYKALAEQGVFDSDAAFQAMQQGLARPVTILDRDAIEAALMSGQGMQAATVTGGGATSGGAFIQNDIMPGFVPLARKTPTLADLVAPGTTDSDTVEYVKQTAVATQAAETAEDAAAPEATVTFTPATTGVVEIPVFVPITRRAMADEGQLRTIVENDLVAGVLDRLDTQLATGDGAGENLTGIYNASGIGTQALGGDTRPDAIHKAFTLIRVAGGVLGEPDGIGMHPNDWQDLRLQKDSNNNYLLGPAGVAGAKQIFGVPAIDSTVFTDGTPLAGAFRRGAQMWLREGVTVTSGLNNDDFTKRRISLLAVMRAAFAVKLPGAFATITGF